jgi:hypothetical protein
MSAAVPRVFVSSTFYDLKSVRAELKDFGEAAGFEVVLAEQGDIPYKASMSPEEACYDAIEGCDVVVSVVGQRYGSRSAAGGGKSISAIEVEKALELGKQLYFFVERNVHEQWRLHAAQDADIAGKIKWTAVDDLAVFTYLDFVAKLPKNNPMFSFDTSVEIVRVLREQLAGLFKSLLQQRVREQYVAEVRKIVDATAILEKLAEQLEGERRDREEFMRDALLVRHPLNERLREVLGSERMIVFENLAQIEAELAHLGYKAVAAEFKKDSLTHHVWSGAGQVIGIAQSLFDASGRVVPLKAGEWRDALLFRRSHSGVS